MTHYGDEGLLSSGGGRRGLRLNFWLVIGRGDNGRPSVRAVARYPALARNERAINLKIELPMALFETPTICASIMVDAPDTPVSIDCSAIADAVQQAIGMDVDIRVAGQ